MRYTFNTLEEYIEMWKHCSIIGIEFSYCRSEQWVESDEFDDYDQWYVENMIPLTE